MLNEKQLQERVMAVFHSQLPEGYVERVIISDAIDNAGTDALLITFVLTPEGVAALTGDQAIDLLVDIQRDFESRGDQRFPIVGYATQAELDEKDAA
jgi:hypothetical protein